MNGPLEGIKVVDLSRILAGPYCSMMLADMGAEVVKVENPDGGDDTRGWGPPFLDGESSYFLSVNRNKQSLTLNLKAERGKALLRDLLRKADVLLENFRPGTLDRLGFGYEAVRVLSPRLVYCSISGFGQTGPDAQRPGYDLVIQGESGVMSLTGSPDGPPMKVGVSIADIVAGMLAAQGITLALLARERTGRGQRIDIALLDGMVSLLTYQSGIYFATGQSPRRRGNEHPTIVPYEVHRARDGYLTLAVGNNALWQRFCEAVGRPDLARDPAFDTEAKRVGERDRLLPIVDAILAERTVAESVRLLGKAGVPCGSIKDVAAVCADPQVLARDMVVRVPHSKLGEVTVTGNPIKLSETPGAVRTGPPLLGEQTDEVLRTWLGLEPEAVADLRREGIV